MSAETPSGARAVVVLPFDGTAPRIGERAVAAEWPVQIVIGAAPFAVMMATPADIEDFAYGFCLTEGVTDAAADIRGVAVEETPDGVAVRVDVRPERLSRHLARRRAMAGRTGCGVCGIEDLAALRRADRPAGGPAPPLELSAIRRALRALGDAQTLNRETGAVHAAAWAGPDGRLALVREDVGRHNALDKLVGAAIRTGVDPREGFVVMTSRCSFELVEKCATFGAGALVTISAPTTLAIARARALDVVLVALARQDTATVFHGAERVVPLAGPVVAA